MTRQAAPEHNGEAVLDERAGTGLFHRSRHLRGWSKWVHGFTCPRCGASCHGRGDRDWHDQWHRDDDEAWEEWAEELTELKNRVAVLEAQHDLIARTHGYALAPLLGDGGGG